MINPLPSLDRTSITFKSDLDAFFLTLLPAFSTQAEAARVQINADTVAADADAAAAALSAMAALASEIAAAAYSSAPRWVSGAVYALDVVRFSPVTGQLYRCISAVSGSTADPSVDATHWGAVQFKASSGYADLAGHADLAGYADLAGHAANVTGIVARANGGTGSSTVPAFSVYRSSAQNLAKITWTKLQFNTEAFDTDASFDGTTNYRFQPSVAGYYHISLQAVGSFGSLAGSLQAALYVNGSAYSVAQNGTTSTSSIVSVSISRLVYFNGSTDYLEAFAYQTNTDPDPFTIALVTGSTGSFLTGHFVRGS